MKTVREMFMQWADIDVDVVDFSPIQADSLC